MASVRKLDPKNPKSVWVVTYTDADGKRRQKTPKTGLKKDAEAIARKIERELEDGVHITKSKTVTFGEAAESYADECERRHKNKQRMAGTTLNKIRVHCRTHVPAWLQKRLLTAVTRDDIQRVLDEHLGHMAPTSRRTIAPFFIQVLKHGVRRGWLKVNVLRDHPLTLPEVIHRRTVPSKTDIQKLLDALTVRRWKEIGHTYQMRVALVALGLYAGLRGGEIAGLQWENVDFEADKLRIRHSYSIYDGLKGPKTRAGIRDVDMPPPLRSVLSSLARIAGPNPEGFVLTARADRLKPIQIANLHQNYWHPMMKAAGLVDASGKRKFSQHQLRHAYISLLIEQGLDPLKIKTIAGHATIQMTMDVYGHLFPEDTRTKSAIMAAAAQFSLESDRRPARVDRRSLPSPATVDATNL